MALNNAHDTGSLSAAQETPSVSDARPSGSAYVLAGLAAAVVDSRGAVVRWTEAAADLTGFTAQEVCGRPVRELVAELPDGLRGTTQMPASGRVRLWRRCGNAVDVAFRTTRLSGSAECLVLAAPAHHVADHEHGAALLRALSSQDRVTVALHDTDLTTVQTNASPGTPGGRPVRPGARLCDVLCTEDAEKLEAVLNQVLETGAPVVRSSLQVSRRHDPARRYALSLSAFRLEDARGRLTGVAALYIDGTDQLRARRHLDLAREVAEQVEGPWMSCVPRRTLLTYSYPRSGIWPQSTWRSPCSKGTNPPSSRAVEISICARPPWRRPPRSGRPASNAASPSHRCPTTPSCAARNTARQSSTAVTTSSP
ncbi:PAS domain S-box protein [Streptomyces sp. NPDC003480]